MAEQANKRSNKVATPKTGGSPAMQPLADPLETLGKAIGARIKLTTAAPHSQTHEGTLFTACPILNIVAINTRATVANAATNATQSGDYHMIPVSRIQNFQILSLPPASEEGFANAQPQIGAVDTRALQQREQARVAQLKEEERNQGKGVTKEAQAIYDAFRRINMDIRWHGQDMIVQDAVIIAPPYRIDDCKSTKDRHEALTRVKKILEGERRKIQEREKKAGAPPAAVATPVAQRKGG